MPKSRKSKEHIHLRGSGKPFDIRNVTELTTTQALQLLRHLQHQRKRIFRPVRLDYRSSRRVLRDRKLRRQAQPYRQLQPHVLWHLRKRRRHLRGLAQMESERALHHRHGDFPSVLERADEAPCRRHGQHDQALREVAEGWATAGKAQRRHG